MLLYSICATVVNRLARRSRRLRAVSVLEMLLADSDRLNASVATAAARSSFSPAAALISSLEGLSFEK